MVMHVWLRRKTVLGIFIDIIDMMISVPPATVHNGTTQEQLLLGLEPTGEVRKDGDNFA